MADSNFLFDRLFFRSSFFGKCHIQYVSFFACHIFVKDKNSKKPLLRGLSIALTFKLAAEIVRTITVRSLAEILQIGALILVKAAITFLIHWEWKSSDVMHKDVDEFE